MTDERALAQATVTAARIELPKFPKYTAAKRYAEDHISNCATYRTGKSLADSVMVALFANGEGNGQAIARRWQRTSSIGRVGAGRIFEMVEIQHELAGLVESVRRKARV
jgi:hypothetical protein